MPYNSDNTLTLPNGSTNAFFGQTIASATWNAIFGDVQTALSHMQGDKVSTLRGVNFNPGAATDVAVSIFLPANSTNYRFIQIQIANASASLTAGSVGLFTGTGGGGTTVIANTTLTLSSTTANTNNSMQTLTGSGTINLTGSPLQFRIITSTGSAATADVSIFVEPQ